MFQPTAQARQGPARPRRQPPTAANRPPTSPACPADRLWKPTDKFVPMARRLPRDLVFLTVSDPRDTLPAFVENLPVLVQQMNLLFPAVQIGARGRPTRPVHQQPEA